MTDHDWGKINLALAEQFEPLESVTIIAGESLNSPAGLWYRGYDSDAITPQEFKTGAWAMLALIEAAAKEKIVFVDICGPDESESAEAGDRYCIDFRAYGLGGVSSLHSAEANTFPEAVALAIYSAIGFETEIKSR